MKNLMTRKLLFGMLMVLVLAFSVQITADAITAFTHRSGDLQTVIPDDEPTIAFSVGIQGNTTNKYDANGNLVDQGDNRIDGSGYLLVPDIHDEDNDRDMDELIRGEVVTPAARYLFNEESISVEVSGAGAGAMITKVGSTPITPTALFTLSETDTGVKRLSSSSVSVTLSFTGVNPKGEVTITVKDTTSDDDRGDNPVAATLTITVYVVEYNTDVAASGITLADMFDNNSNNVGYQWRDDQRDQPIGFSVFGDTSVPITFRVKGPGRVYVSESSSRRGSSQSTLNTSSDAPVFLDMNGGTNRVTVEVSSVDDPETALYTYGRPQIARIQGNNQEGTSNARLEESLGVKVTDGRNAVLSDVPVTFSATNAGMIFAVPGKTLYDSGGERILATETLPAAASPLEVYTDSRGETYVYFQLGDNLSPNTNTTATATSLGASATFMASVAGNQGSPSISVVGSPNRSTESNGKIPVNAPLVVVVKGSAGQRLPMQEVTFTTATGFVIGATTGKSVPAMTDRNGEAKVGYDIGDGSGSVQVVAEISGETPFRYRDEVTFGINGGRSTTPPPTILTPPPTTRPTLTLSSSTLTGAASTSVPLAATVRNSNGPVPGIGVTFILSVTGSGAILTPVVVTNSSGVAQTNVILPNTNGVVTATANVNGVPLTQGASITVTGGTSADTGTTDTGTDTSGQTAAPSSISISGGSSFTGEPNIRLSDPLTVRVLDTNGNGTSGEIVFFSIVEGRGRLSPGRTRTDNSGYAEISFTPISSGTIVVEAASGDLSPVTFTITTGEPPDAITLVSGNNQSGRPGAALANPFIVEVIDANDDAVSGVTVTFAVTAGGGTLSATSDTTNANGRAQTTLTLGDTPGDNTVAARVTGLAGITFKATSGSQVLVDASQRAPMYWISRTNGKLHRLVDDEIENLAPNVTGVTSLAVDSADGLLYFGVKMGENRGAVRRSNLNGKSVQTLKTLTSVPTGIAIDSAGGTVYWTNSRGRIQSIPTEGSAKITNVLQNLPNPMALVLSNGHLYWGEPLGRLRRVSLTDAQKIVQNIATGLGEPLSLSIAKGKLYWTERDAGGSGRLQRSNLDGSSIQEIKMFASGVPIGIVVDSADNKIYWTKAAGKIQRGNLAGRFVRDIATGIMNPGDIALGTEVADEPVVETVTRTPRTTQTTPKADNAKYDVNGDGAVNNIDVTLVAVSLGSSNAKYDVNGDGTVDANDLRAVIANADDAAAAPAIDVDFTTLNVDMIQEQIDILLASSDTSLAGQRTLAYLQQMLASARPDETVLLANYPNPFNPETWIPYHLATGTDVQVNIYNTQGTLVRMLTLGHQSAGYYTSRSRAAYWDGRNALGERVASGIYFYQLQTDKISLMRKMVILK